MVRRALLARRVLADFDTTNPTSNLVGAQRGPSSFRQYGWQGISRDRQSTNPWSYARAVSDCDGALEMAGGPWGDQAPADHGETTKPLRDYVYLKNHAVENGATPIFDAQRKPYELGWREKYHCR